MYKILVRVKASGIDDNKNGPNLVFYNQLGEAVTAYLWATPYYGVTKTLDGDWWNVEFSFRSIADCEGMKFDWCDVYKWTGTDNKVVKIGIIATNTKEQIIDYIRLVKTVAVAEEDISIKYNGGEVAGEYTTADDFDWTKFTVDGYGAAFTLTSGGAAVEQTARLAKGDYTLTATLTGKYVGSKSINFHVREVVVPDQVTDLAFDKTAKTLTFTKANGAASYEISAKDKAGKTIELAHTEATEGETVTVTITSDLPAGYVTFAVRSVSSDNIRSEAVETTVAILGNTSFGAPKAEGSMYTYIANFNHADYAAFATAGNNVTSITGTESGLVVEGTKYNNNGNPDVWNSYSIDIPTDINVENKDFIVEFTFNGLTDNIVFVTINLYNEEGKSSYAYVKTNTWVSAQYTEGGVHSAFGSGGNTVKVRLSAAKFAVDKDCLWTNKKAKKITKISISYATGDGKLPIKDIIVYDDYSSVLNNSFISKTTVTIGKEQGTTVFDVKEDANVTYNEYSVKDGVLSYTAPNTFSTFTTYTLPEAVALTTNSVIKLRIKGDVCATLYNEKGTAVCKQIKSYAWGNDGGVEYTSSEADAEGYRICTIAADNITSKTQIKSITFTYAGGTNKSYIDYIAVVG